jgi:hypothetical protein
MCVGVREKKNTAGAIPRMSPIFLFDFPCTRKNKNAAGAIPRMSPMTPSNKAFTRAQVFPIFIFIFIIIIIFIEVLIHR